MYHFWVTVTLTSDLVLITFVSGAYLLYYFLDRNPKVVCGCILGL